MMSTSLAHLIANLNTATFWLNVTIPILQITFGTFGNLFNIIIFTRPSLRINPCSLYFLVGSINNLFVLYVAVLTRFLINNWGIDPTATNNALCKLRNIFVFPNLCIILWLIVLASIDRYFSSSQNVRLRQLSSLPKARKAIILTIILIYLMHAHMLIFYKSDISGGVFACTIFSREYNIFFQFFTFFFLYFSNYSNAHLWYFNNFQRSKYS